MSLPDFTVVLGVDAAHIEHLRLSLVTWAQHKPSLFDHPWVVFCEGGQVEVLRAFREIPVVPSLLSLVNWPYQGVMYPEGDGSKWQNRQRYMMLSGFVHIPAEWVNTPYWLKLDLDVLATGVDNWIDPSWFRETPAIISHRWGYTKPANQMQELDEWAVDIDLPRPPLDLIPSEGAGSLGHKRIISWCAFFNTEFTRRCSDLAAEKCGRGHLPVPSQDGYLWYLSQRYYEVVVRTNMKSRGWSHCSGLRKMKRELSK